MSSKMERLDKKTIEVLSSVVELDGIIIETLASDTRRNILQKLDTLPRTASEISRESNINKSAIIKHLKLLEKAGLIVRRKTDNKFIYFELTTKGHSVIKVLLNR